MACSPIPVDHWESLLDRDAGNGDNGGDTDADTDTDTDTDADSDGDADDDSDSDCGDEDGGDCIEDDDDDDDDTIDTDTGDGDTDTVEYYCGEYPCELFASGSGFKFDNTGRPFIGNGVTPEVVMTGFSYFYCPHCKNWAATLHELFADPAYAGRVVYYFGHYPFGSAGAERWFTHNAAIAAHIQHEFWAVHDNFFGSNYGLPPALVRETVEAMGILDMAQFDIDVAAASTTAVIERDKAELQAAMLEMEGTSSVGVPSVWINGIKVKPRSAVPDVLDYLLGYR